MKMKIVKGSCFGVLLGFICLAVIGASAQSERPVSINVGGGFSPLVGHISNELDNGWHITGGVGFHLGPLTIGPQVMYSGFGVSQHILQLAHAPNGDAHVWSITADP